MDNVQTYELDMTFVKESYEQNIFYYYDGDYYIKDFLITQNPDLYHHIFYSTRPTRVCVDNVGNIIIETEELEEE